MRLENKILEEKVGQRTIQLEQKSTELEKSLDNLKSTQAQLIQSEKMASLGELTAGIAHEIQNPLNFVNNFSEVNTELIEEMKHELEVGNSGEAIAIANDLEENLQRINHHGKRADAIVKGMLQHSRASTGKKELTDINALADEYLRLSYHGLRAKDKSFNATMQTNLIKVLKNKYYSSEYRKSVAQFIQQRILCSYRKEETATRKLRTNNYHYHKSYKTHFGAWGHRN